MKSSSRLTKKPADTWSDVNLLEGCFLEDDLEESPLEQPHDDSSLKVERTWSRVDAFGSLDEDDVL